MNNSDSKHDNTLDESSDHSPKDTYCKNVIPILIQNAADHYMIKKVQQELETERLTREHAEIDKKIAAKLEQIKKTQKVSAELDRQVYNATQMKNQSKTRFKTTGEIINVLKDETEKIQNHAKKIETKRLDITKKVQGFVGQKKRNEESKRKVENLEKQIKELLDASELTLDENLPRRNEELKKRLQEKNKEFEIKRMKKNQIAQMKELKVDLLIKINKKQEENKIKIEEIEVKKVNIKKVKEEWEQKWQEMEEKISNEEAKRDELTQKLTESKKRYEENQIKMDEQKARISQKEIELENFKKNCAQKQDFIKTENEKKEREYENEKEKLLDVEKKIETQLEKSEQNLNVLKEKTQELTNLKTEKEDLTVRIYETKINILTRQFENREQQNNMLAEKLRFEKDEVEKLKIRNEDLEKTRKEAEKKLEEYPKELEEKRQKLELRHKEKIEVLLKQQNFHTASMEFAQHRLDSALKEAENLKREIQDLKEKNDWAEMVITRRQTNLRALQERIKMEQQAYEKLLERVKQKEKQSFEVIKTDQVGPSKESIMPPQKEFNETLNGKNTVKPSSQELEPMETTEIIDNEENLSSNGRKSPGILKKSPNKPKRPQTPTKRVTFEGISSESSSQSIETHKEGAISAEDANLDVLLDNWKNVVVKKSTKKNPMDF